MTIGPDRRLLHYRLVEKIGEGGMGEVYVAEDPKLKRRVALKILPAEFASDPERRARFEREAQAVAALNHPNIVTIHSVEQEGDVHFITMEYVEGQSLTELMSADGMPLEQILDIAGALADAIAAAHERGITHRDLKPDNVMVSSEGRVKVLDFGLAKLDPTAPSFGDDSEEATATATQQGRIMGTVRYMSPEQVEGEPVDARSDVFSLGIILYEMATGRRPFEGATNISILSSILKDTPKPISEHKRSLPRDLHRIVSRCLEKNPRNRFSSAVGLLSEISALQRERGHGRRSGLEVGQPWHPARWVALAAALLALLLGLIAAPRLLRGPSEDEQPVVEGTADARRIVVLPFQNQGPDEHQYFAEGVTEEINSRLAAVEGLSVVSRKTAMRYAGTDKTIQEIGRELDVEYVLEGTIRWAPTDGGGSRVKITPQLVRVSDDTQLWAQPYDRVIDDIFQLQAEIAGNVIGQLGVQLNPPERRTVESRPTESLEAYQAYLQGRFYMDRFFTEESNRLALQALQRAVEIDPAFFQAHSELSIAHARMYHAGYDKSNERIALARLAADRTVELAPDSLAARMALGYFHYWVYKDYEAALKEFSEAVARKPGDVGAIRAMAYVLRRQGNVEEALRKLEQAQQLSPLEYELVYAIGETQMWMRSYESADGTFDLGIRVAAGSNIGYQWKIWNHWLWKGAPEGARATLDALPIPDDHGAKLTRFLQGLYEGRYAEALDELSARPVDVVRHLWFFLPESLLRAQLLELLERSAEAEEAYRSAMRFLEGELDRRPDDYRVHAALSLAYAGLGRGDEAAHAAERAVEIYPVSRDAMWGPAVVENLALVYTKLGRYEEALERIEYLLSIPSLMSIPLLELDPRWAPLRNHPRYEKLVSEYG